MKNSDGERIVNCYDWVGYFQSLGFRSIHQIFKYHMFCCDVQHPGAVFVKYFSDSDEMKVQVVKAPLILDASPPTEIEHKGLDIERQWYLYDKIRQLCHTNLSRDITCPKPSQPKVQSASKTLDATVSCAADCNAVSESVVTAGSKRCLCSICHSPGHNKKTCPNKE